MHAVSHLSRPFLRLAVIGALAAALGLAGCGRKGPLDPPPAAAAPTGQPAESTQPGFMTPFGGPPGTSSSTGQIASGGGGGAGVDASGQAVAPKGPHKSIPLDVLLN
jgi:predicted small lipoprotein YifL